MEERKDAGARSFSSLYWSKSICTNVFSKNINESSQQMDDELF